MNKAFTEIHRKKKRIELDNKSKECQSYQYSRHSTNVKLNKKTKIN